MGAKNKITREQFWDLGMKFVKESDMDNLNLLFLCVSKKDLPWCVKRLIYSDPKKKIGYGLISYAFLNGDYDMMNSIKSLYGKKIKIHVKFLADAAKFNKFYSFKWLKETNKNVYDNCKGGLQKNYIYCDEHDNIPDNEEVFYNACLNDIYLINTIEEVYKCKISEDVVVRCASRGNLELFEWALKKYKENYTTKVSIDALLGARNSGNTRIVKRILHNDKYFEIDNTKE